MLLMPHLNSMYHSFVVRELTALLNTRLLPISDFSNGHVYFLQKVSQNLEVWMPYPTF